MRWVVAMLLVVAAIPSAVGDVHDHAWASENRPFRVGVSTNTAPASHAVGNETYGGWGPDMLAIGTLKLGITVEYVPFDDYATGVAMLRDGDVDAVGVMAQRPDLLEFATMNTPWAWAPVVLLTHDGHDWTSLDDAEGTISTIPGSPIEAQVHERFPHMTYVTTSNPAEGVQALARGDIDAYVGPLAVIGHQIQIHQLDGLRPVGESLSVVQSGFWAKDPVAVATLDAIRAAVSPDEARVLHVKWTGYDLGNPDREAALPAWLLPVIGASAAAILALAVLAAFQRLRVRSVRAELDARRAQDAAAEAESRLRESRRLQAFTRDIMNRAAHEFATPLTPALAAAATLRASDLGESDRKKLELLERNLHRLRDVHRSLVVAARADAERLADGGSEAA